MHNALLLDHVERSVMRGPFRPFPRSLGGRTRFSRAAQAAVVRDSRTGTAVAEGLTRWHMTHNIAGLIATLTKAMRS